MKRYFDFSLALFLILLMSIPIIFLFILNFFSPNLNLIHWSRRIGKNNIEFLMPKIRTMKMGTPNVSTDMLNKPEKHITKIGSFLRRYSIDEIPQIWSILKGDMSFVGPRPALYSQSRLIKLRCKNNIDKILPGITGWAQINGRDNLSLVEKIAFEKEYLNRKSFLFDFKIICLTVLRIFIKKNISH